MQRPVAAQGVGPIAEGSRRSDVVRGLMAKLGSLFWRTRSRDHGRCDAISHFAPYRAETGGLDAVGIEHAGRAIADSLSSQGLVNEFALYERLLDFLAARGDRFDVRPLGELLAPLDDDRARVCLRHDVDSLTAPALRAAQALTSRGLVGSFYVLHTASYYGEFKGDVFVRNEGLGSILEDLVVGGNELGLHIDPLHVYLTFSVDGRQAVLTELAWLRSHGIRLTGVLAHNSAPAYGAENFEIFEGMALDDRRVLKRGKVTVALQTIRMADAGLAYEGNFPGPPRESDRHLLEAYLGYVPDDAIRRPDWLCIYLQRNPVFSRAEDVSIWLLGPDMWAVAESRPRERFLYGISLSEVISYLDSYRARGRIVIVIHPEYICQ